VEKYGKKVESIVRKMAAGHKYRQH
jgi:hypothetical protein